MRRRAGGICLAALGFLLGGCSFAAGPHLGDVTMGLQSGFAAMGSHVGIFLH
jgi:hypothetical protein